MKTEELIIPGALGVGAVILLIILKGKGITPATTPTKAVKTSKGSATAPGSATRTTQGDDLTGLTLPVDDSDQGTYQGSFDEPRGDDPLFDYSGDQVQIGSSSSATNPASALDDYSGATGAGVSISQGAINPIDIPAGIALPVADTTTATAPAVTPAPAPAPAKKAVKKAVRKVRKVKRKTSKKAVKKVSKKKTAKKRR